MEEKGKRRKKRKLGELGKELKSRKGIGRGREDWGEHGEELEETGGGRGEAWRDAVRDRKRKKERKWSL